MAQMKHNTCETESKNLKNGEEISLNANSKV